MDEKLRQFKGIVDAGSFTQAARDLHISQPALSTAIAKLEKELRVSLLNRQGKSFTVTQAGKVAYWHALDSAHRKKQLLENIASYNGQPAELKIGMIDSIGELFCRSTSLLSRLEEQYRVSIIINSSTALTEAVRKQELDYAFIVGSDTTALPHTLLGHEPMLHVAPARNAVETSRFISYNRESTTFRIIEQAFIAQGETLEPEFYSTSPEIMLRLVTLGRGHAILPYLTVKESLLHKRLVVLPMGEARFIRRPIIALYHQQHPSMNTMVSQLKKALQTHEKAAAALVSEAQ